MSKLINSMNLNWLLNCPCSNQKNPIKIYLIKGKIKNSSLLNKRMPNSNKIFK